MISVAIATYNGEKYFAEQLESIVQQTILPEEIIIRDDRSTDGTVKIAEAFEKRYPGIKWDIEINSEQKGFIKNFIGAIKHCNGDIIILCDQDDKWRPDKVEYITSFFDDPNVMSLHGDIDIIDENDNIIKPGALGYSAEKEKITLDQFFRHIYYCGMSSAFRRDLIECIDNINIDNLPVHDWMIHALAVVKNGFYKTSRVLSDRRFHYDNVALNLSKTERKGMEQRISVVDYYCWHYSLLYEFYQKFGDCTSREAEFAKKILDVNKNRLAYLKNNSLMQALKSVRWINYYPTKKSFASDMLYLLRVF